MESENKNMLQLLLQISSQDILYTAQHELQLIKLSAIMTESLCWTPFWSKNIIITYYYYY